MMAKVNDYKKLIERAKEIEKHEIPSDEEIEIEETQFRRMRRLLKALLKPQWYMNHRTNKKIKDNIEKNKKDNKNNKKS